MARANAVYPLIKIDSIPNELSLDTSWRFHAGDDMQWASPAYDDSRWDSLWTILYDKNALAKLKGNGWFRIHLKVAPSLFQKTFILAMDQKGASEVYLNGKRIYKFGEVAAIADKEVPMNPGNRICFIQFSSDTFQVIAIRYSAFKALARHVDYPGFHVKLASWSELNLGLEKRDGMMISCIFLASIFLSFSLFHFLLFLFHRKVRSNLYYSFMALIIGLFWLFPVVGALSSYPFIKDSYGDFLMYTYTPFFIFSILLLYSIFDVKPKRFFWIILAIAVVAEITIAFDFHTGYFICGSVLISAIETLRVAIYAVRKKKPGARAIAIGFGIFNSIIIISITLIGLLVIFYRGKDINDSSLILSIILFIIFLLFCFSIPTSMSFYLAGNFARTNKSLALQLEHVRQLGEQNLEKEKEKQQIIEGQKEMLEKQVKEKTSEIQAQKDKLEENKNELEEKNKAILGSITYAKRLQDAILPPMSLIKKYLPESFVLYKPKDIVAGDFYWMERAGDNILITAADCTGHGVPGALVSVVCSNALNRTVKEFHITEPGKILDKVRELVLETFERSESSVQDGMDISLCCINTQTREIQWSGAYNPLWYIQNGEIHEVEADKQPIGKYDKATPFNTYTLKLQKGDTLYLFTDGYADQFGGVRNKKFKYKQLQEMLLATSGLTMEEQKMKLEESLDKWKGDFEQIDDILVIGIRV